MPKYKPKVHRSVCLLLTGAFITFSPMVGFTQPIGQRIRMYGKKNSVQDSIQTSIPDSIYDRIFDAIYLMDKNEYKKTFKIAEALLESPVPLISDKGFSILEDIVRSLRMPKFSFDDNGEKIYLKNLKTYHNIFLEYINECEKRGADISRSVIERKNAYVSAAYILQDFGENDKAEEFFKNARLILEKDME